MKRGEWFAGLFAFFQGFGPSTAHVEDADGDLVLRPAIFGEIFAPHDGLLLDHVSVTETGPKNAGQSFGQLRVVVSGGSEIVSELDLGQAVLRQARRQGLA